MAALHSALLALGPCRFEDVPRSPPELEPYLQDLFQQAQLILESIPIPPPDEKIETRPPSHTTTSIASNASEISSSSARSSPPIPEYAALQKEWGKPIKFSAKDNPLNMAVYKMGGKDGKGAWFARRSVQEGLGFAKFKRSLEMEFPESLAVQGAPGEGNVRGIGGDKKVEDISVPGRGRVEVFQLSAQFPGPTTPRDFVTLLVTSSNAIKQNDDSARRDLAPRHYMIISKPCDHPATQPRDGFVRGNYESVEFIREVPRRPKQTMSSLDLTKLGAGKGGTLEKEALLRNSEKKTTNTMSTNHENRSMNDLSTTKGSDEVIRRRGKTISFSGPKADDLRADGDGVEEQYDPEANPVEWIMVTRSDPGGSVPRFMVERGTPGSIVADAAKFLNWACQNEDIEDSKSDTYLELGNRRESISSYQTNGRLAGLDQDAAEAVARSDELSSTVPSTSHSQAKSANQAGILSDMTGALSAGLEAYAPQIVLDYLPGHTPQGSVRTGAGSSTTLGLDVDEEDSSDSMSTTSFASADSHLDNESSTEQPSSGLSAKNPISSSQQKHETKDSSTGKSKTQLTSHEKELAKLSARRTALEAKLASTRTKSAQSAQSQTQKEKEALRKAEEKHAKEMAKQEEKYRREIEKIEQRKKREEKKVEDRRRKEQEKAEERRKKEEEKDQRTKVERERDEAREEAKRLRAEIGEVWTKRVEMLEAEIRELKGSGKKDGDVREGEEEEEDGGKGKGTAVELPSPVLPAVERDFASKNLLKEERSSVGSRMRGVSFGSGSPKVNGNGNTSTGAGSNGENGKSTASSLRGSSLLKRATTTMGMMSAEQEHKKGASS